MKRPLKKTCLMKKIIFLGGTGSILKLGGTFSSLEVVLVVFIGEKNIICLSHNYKIGFLFRLL